MVGSRRIATEPNGTQKIKERIFKTIGEADTNHEESEQEDAIDSYEDSCDSGATDNTEHKMMFKKCKKVLKFKILSTNQQLHARK